MDVNEKQPGKRKPTVRPWLEAMLDSHQIRGLEWINKESKVWKLPWKHHRPTKWGDPDAILLHKLYDKDGSEEPSKEDLKRWKSLLRNSLRSLNDVKELKHLHCQDDRESPYKVYQFLDGGATDQQGGASPSAYSDSSDSQVSSRPSSANPNQTIGNGFLSTPIVTPFTDVSPHLPLTCGTQLTEVLQASPQNDEIDSLSELDSILPDLVEFQAPDGASWRSRSPLSQTFVDFLLDSPHPPPNAYAGDDMHHANSVPYHAVFSAPTASCMVSTRMIITVNYFEHTVALWKVSTSPVRFCFVPDEEARSEIKTSTNPFEFGPPNTEVLELPDSSKIDDLDVSHASLVQDVLKKFGRCITLEYDENGDIYATRLCKVIVCYKPYGVWESKKVNRNEKVKIFDFNQFKQHLHSGSILNPHVKLIFSEQNPDHRSVHVLSVCISHTEACKIMRDSIKQNSFNTTVCSLSDQFDKQLSIGKIERELLKGMPSHT